MPIPWLDSLTVGVPAFDGEHREMLDLLNRARAHADLDETEQARATMEAYIALLIAHCDREEQIMRDTGYHRAEDHARSHKVAIEHARQVPAILAEPSRKGEVGPVILDMQNHLIRRILLDDGALAVYLDHIGMRS
jgi:hemerythrin